MLTENNNTNKENFSIVKRVKSITHAGRGLWLFVKNTHNARIHMIVLILVIIAGFYFKITSYEWVSVVLVSGLVLVAEAFNTAIEIDIDLTSPEYHPYARDTKDVAAGAVLISSIVAIIIGIIIFSPHILNLFR